MSRENAARRLNRFKDDNDDDDDDNEDDENDDDDNGIFVQSLFVSARASSFAARDIRSSSFYRPPSILSPADQPPWLRQMARIYFAARRLVDFSFLHYASPSLSISPLFLSLSSPFLSQGSSDRVSPFTPRSGFPAARALIFLPVDPYTNISAQHVGSREHFSFRNNRLTAAIASIE